MTAGKTSSECFDLTGSISPFLDRHMIFPLLDFLQTQASYSADDLELARFQLLRPTNMVETAKASFDKLKTKPESDDWSQKKKDVEQKLKALTEQAAPLTKFTDEQREKMIASGTWNVASLVKEDPAITEPVVKAYRELSRFTFEAGDYAEARKLLRSYISLFASAPTTSDADTSEEAVLAGINTQAPKQTNENLGHAAMYYLSSVDTDMLNVLWGLLASEILLNDYEGASVAVDAVKVALDALVNSNDIPPLQALQQRTWLLHWSLFVYWFSKSGLDRLVDLFLSDRYRSITAVAPHLLRYLTAAVLLCKRNSAQKSPEVRKMIRSLSYLIQDCSYVDPIVEFVKNLCVNYDFEAAQTKLGECEQVLAADFFLSKKSKRFMDEARVFVFENYCRIHHKIDIDDLGEKLAMDQSDAERWIVNLIRNADLDAKIDSEAKCVVMGKTPQSIYQQVMDRTRDLNVRGATLVQTLQNVLGDARKEKTRLERLAREEE